ncbi:MAG: thioredoxin domain-containing protein [Candidatus Babeliaceae bacterium]
MKNMTKTFLASLCAWSIITAHIELTDKTFEKFIADAKVPVIVDFGAEWCGPCKQMKPELEKIDKKLNGKYLIATVDINKAADTAVKYDIQAVPTFIIFKDGKKIDSFSGFHTAEKLLETVEALLAGKKIDTVSTPELPLEQQLLQALFKQNTAEIKKVLEKGANPNYIFQFPSPYKANETIEFTALSIASEIRSTELMTLLLDAGADIQLKVKSFITHKPVTIIQLLEQEIKITGDMKNIIATHKVDRKATSDKAFATKNCLLPKNIPDEKEQESLNQQLFTAIGMLNKSEVKTLLEKGANPNYIMKIPMLNIIVENTPLVSATGTFDPEIVSILLDAGADLTLKTKTSPDGEELTIQQLLDKRVTELQDQIIFLKSYKKKDKQTEKIKPNK